MSNVQSEKVKKWTDRLDKNVVNLFGSVEGKSASLGKSHSCFKNKHYFVNFQLLRQNLHIFAVILLIILKLFVLLQLHCGV